MLRRRWVHPGWTCDGEPRGCGGPAASGMNCINLGARTGCTTILPHNQPSRTLNHAQSQQSSLLRLYWTTVRMKLLRHVWLMWLCSAP
jgi:hypothetical protein